MSPTTHNAPSPNLPFRGDPAQQGGEVSETQGRAVSARNATTHGLFTQDVVLPALGEDPAAFDALLQQLCQQLPPRNLLERHYLEQIAAASWRLRRLHRWQAQVYEDPAIDEDARLDKLDKTLRHENTLTRQIDRAVRLLGRDLADLFAGRARDLSLRDFDATERECKNEPDLAIEVQRRVWRRIHDADTHDADTHDADTHDADTHDADTHDADTRESVNCENEPAPPEPPAAPPPAPADAHTQADAHTRNCENGPPAPAPNLPSRGDPAQQGREVPPSDSPPHWGAAGAAEQAEGAAGGDAHEKCENELPLTLTRTDAAPEAELAHHKREQEVYHRFHPDALPPDWDAPLPGPSLTNTHSEGTLSGTIRAGRTAPRGRP